MSFHKNVEKQSLYYNSLEFFFSKCEKTRKKMFFSPKADCNKVELIVCFLCLPQSAVLSAIVFGLGGHASTSNRGKSNKGLIRNGQSSAKVEITMYNQGEDAYRHEVYGDSITIVRSVGASGGGGYNLKDHRKLVVQDKKVKEEVDRIMSHFSIQVDNPIAVSALSSLLQTLHSCL